MKCRASILIMLVQTLDQHETASGEPTSSVCCDTSCLYAYIGTEAKLINYNGSTTIPMNSGERLMLADRQCSEARGHYHYYQTGTSYH